MNIYVGNLSSEVTQEELQKTFEVFCNVENAHTGRGDDLIQLIGRDVITGKNITT